MIFDEKFLQKSILIISDNDQEYTEFEKNGEKIYLEKLFKEIKKYTIYVFIEEVLNEKELREVLSKYKNDEVIIFNWCERFSNTDGTETQVTKIYEELGFTFTGGSTKTLELVADKFKCIQKLQSANVRVPESYLVKKEDVEKFDLDFSKKYMVKSNNFHASAGISMLNLVATKQDFLTVAKGLIEYTNGDIMVQKYIEGDEYTVLVWGSVTPEVLPIIKLNFGNKNLPNILTQSAKFEPSGTEYINTTYEMLDEKENIYSNIKDTVLSAYKALEMEDYARFDVRVNNNEVYVIDYNSNPYINSLYEGDDCEVYKCTRALGYNWGETILKICEHAYMRSQRNIL